MEKNKRKKGSLFPGWPSVLKFKASVNTDETSRPTVWNVSLLATLYVRKNWTTGRSTGALRITTSSCYEGIK